MLIDTHCHLNDERLLSDVQKIVSEMDGDNILALVNAGYDRKSSEMGVAFSEKYEKVFATVGIHPHSAKEATMSDYERFFELSRHEKVVAIGEVGLDYYYDLSPRDTQKEVFVSQLRLASEAGLPVVLHIRDAYGDALGVLKDNKNLLKNGVLLHCYTGSVETAREFLRLGFVFSFGGVITFANARHPVMSLKEMPDDCFMLETDCPYMTPVPHRGKTNYPKYVNLVAEKAAEIRGVEVEKIAEITTKNAQTFFGKLKI